MLSGGRAQSLSCQDMAHPCLAVMAAARYSGNMGRLKALRPRKMHAALLPNMQDNPGQRIFHQAARHREFE